MVPDFATERNSPAQDIFFPFAPETPAKHKECRPRVILLQYIQYLVGDSGLWAVVKRQRDHWFIRVDRHACNRLVDLRLRRFRAIVADERSQLLVSIAVPRRVNRRHRRCGWQRRIGGLWRLRRGSNYFDGVRLRTLFCVHGRR